MKRFLQHLTFIILMSAAPFVMLHSTENNPLPALMGIVMGTLAVCLALKWNLFPHPED
jgi:hypothetical protein